MSSGCEIGFGIGDASNASSFLSSRENRKDFGDRVQCNWLGQIDFAAANELQLLLAQQLRSKNKIEILGCEHPAVVTLGRRADPAKEVLSTQLPALQIDRGGLATLHAPGQLVIYPIADVRKIGLGGLKPWVCLLLKVTAATIEDMTSQKMEIGERQDGVYFQGKKIAFMGLRIDRGVSRHGISINVHNDLSLFDQIRACGVGHQQMMKVGEFNPMVGVQGMFDVWCARFSQELLASEQAGLVVR